ncbi:MAG TPA: archaeosortase/exosortase family protein, partial [Opitutaceae bacterium]|nr:archaeosortase/exosortase family protein [Opitutaceae bacterium]
GMLILLVPLPVGVRAWMESSLQHWSAQTAVVMLDLAGTPVFNTGNSLQLSDISLQVAPECSGIHSSVALFITSLVAGQLFLRSNWKRTVLSAAVIPLGILRNGFRVFTIGELCVHIGPEMIDSKIHHQGGPLFFALSLVPFLLLLYFLIRSEKRARQPKPISP